jgi:1-acyl-sn-glycerol-3-phosphate acyltransferase
MEETTIQYPRRRLIRSILRSLIGMALGMLGDFTVEGKENLDKGGPLLVVANHFHFLDPVVLIRAVQWPLEFVGGAQTPNAPSALSWLTSLYGVIPTYRGTGARSTIKTSELILAQKGVLAIFPEGGSWAQVLRPARPGTAFLATQMNTPLLPIGIEVVLDFFPRIKVGKRPHINLRIGKPFGPFFNRTGKRPSREELNHIGDTIMGNIAELIPPERRGFYSSDPLIRDAALGTEIYPWENHPEA